MKQNYFTILLTMLLSMIGVQASAHDFEAVNSDGVTIYYSFWDNDKALSVTFRGLYDDKDYNNYSDRYTGHVAIPESVTYEGKTYPVTQIGRYAFYRCTGLTSISIPHSVTNISDAFEGCTALTSITIPNSVVVFDVTALAYCTGLESITVEEGNRVFDSRNNCNAVIRTATNTLEVGCKNTVIPNDVKEIDNVAFLGCSGMSSITIPNGVEIIGGGAFRACSGLTSITIPQSVTSIGSWTFYESNNLTSIIIMNNEGLHIEDNFIRDCKALTDIYLCAETMPNTDTYAFYNAPLENITVHVPASAVDGYKAAPAWSGFKDIVTLTEEELASVGSITAQPTAETRFTIGGQHIAAPRKGVNIVKRGDKVVKVLVN